MSHGKSGAGLHNSAGLHLIMDGRVVDPKVFTKENLVRLLGLIVKALDMKPLDKVHIYEVPVDATILERVRNTGKFEDEGGISTIQVISTSHITLHAWPLQRYFALDAFSCKLFNSELAMDIIREHLNVLGENTIVIYRSKPEVGNNARIVRYIEA